MHPPSFLKTNVIALTGGIATGKSTVARILRQHGWTVIDADLLAREVTQPGQAAYDEIISAFGPEVTQADRSLNRAWLRQKIIADPQAKSLLESITHPAIQQRFLEKTRDLQLGNRDLFYEASLIVEAGRHDEFKELWVCHVPPHVQIDRLCQRDQMSPEQAQQMLSRQMPNDEKIKYAQVVIDTNCPIDAIVIPFDRLKK
jgi:dephospho-CoA kinase